MMVQELSVFTDIYCSVSIFSALSNCEKLILFPQLAAKEECA